MTGLDAAAWTPWAGLYLVLVLVLGPGASWLAWRKYQGGPPRDGLDRRDLAAAALVLVALALRLALLERSPITGDEASNLELDFWRTWYLAAESRANPPLFRFLIHLTAIPPERLWLIRLPAALFGGLGLWLFYRAARRRTGFALALGLTAVLSLDALQVDYALEQKAYTLWLCLLLAAQERFCAALAGRARSWAGYALWSGLAVLTHYLTPFMLLAHLLWVARKQRAQLRGLALALTPAALLLAAMAVPVLLSGADAVSTRDPSRSLIGHLAAQTLTRPSVIGAGLMLLALLGAPARPPGPGDRALPWVVLAAAVGPLVIGLRTPVWARYFFPLLPFVLLWLAGRLERRPGRWRWRRRVLAGLGAAVVVLGGVWALARHAAEPGRDPLLAAVGEGRRAAVTLVQPPWKLDSLAFELTGRRDIRNNACPGSRDGQPLRDDGGLMAGVSSARTEADMERALARVGRFDVLVYHTADGYGAPAVARWLARRCSLLASVSAGPDGAHAAYRCEAGPARPRDDPCDLFAGGEAR